MRKFYSFTLAALFASLLSTTESSSAADYIWWEGEDYDVSNWPSGSRNTSWPSWQGWWQAQNDEERAKLSEGVWLNTGSPPSTILYAEYTVDVTATSTYDLYARRFWSYGDFRWRFDDGPVGGRRSREGTSVRPVAQSRRSAPRKGRVRLAPYAGLR